MKKRVFLLLLAVLLSVSACSSPEEEPATAKQYDLGEIEIALPSEFSPFFLEGYDMCFVAPGVDVYVLQEPFALAEELKSMTTEDYGRSQIAASELGEEVPVKKEDGICYYEYTADTQGGQYHYVTCLYQTDTAFWVVQFVTPLADANLRRGDIFKWAKSVFFS